MKQSKEQQVWVACQNLHKQGLSLKEISARKIQETLALLGWPRGSLRDIYRYKKTWLKKKNMEEQTQSTPPLEEAFHGQARLEGENELLRERINDLSFDFIALQKKYQMLFEENKLLAAKCHALDIKLQKQVLTTTVEPSTQLQEVVQHYEAKLDRLQKENTQLQLTVSDLKQNMEHKRHEHILQIDKLKVEKEKLQKLVDRHVLKL